jgi:2,4-dienoyl-CoA reductase (NADPH2)
MRISATDWVKGGWDIEQSIELARRAKERGIDLIDVSSGALVPDAKVPVGKASRSPSPSAFAPRRRSKPRRSA